MTSSRRQSTGSSRHTCCGCLASCCSAVRRVTRWRGTCSEDRRRALGCRASDQLGQLCSCGRVHGAVLGGVEGSILLGCPMLLQLWCHERFAIGRLVVPLYACEPLPEGHDPCDRFTMGSLWCLQKVISYLSLSICLSISSSLLNRHL
jgi:hypothetical protein